MGNTILSNSEILKNKVLSQIKFQLSVEQEKTISATFLFLEKSQNAKLTLNIEKAEEFSKIALSEIGAGINTLCASILYGTFVKEDIDIPSIEKLVSKNVSTIIKGILKIPILRKEKYTKNNENFINLLLTVTQDVRAVLIRLVEQIYKIRHINEFPEPEQIVIAQQTSELFAPMAHRIGLYKIKTELEETAMKYTHTEMFKFIAKKLKDTKKERDIYIEDFIKPIQDSLKKNDLNFLIKGRPKSIFSIWKKMQKQGVPFEEVYDLFAIRIILKTSLDKEKDECWKVYSIITDSYKSNPKRLRDWISSPKTGGYESLHTTVLGHQNKWIEVQIRTERMDEIAEKGPAAHWKYKSGESNSSTDWLTLVREAIENPHNIDDHSEDKAKKALYSSEIFVFTPDGDLKSFKPGYTVLDFAFNIHSKVGETCSGAIVNGIIKPLNYEIQNGDTVKIITNKNKRPNNEWLNIAKSSKVLNKIRQLIKLKDFKQSELGKEILKQKFSQLKIDYSEINIQKATNYFNADEPIKFYQLLGEGKIDVLKIKKAFEEKKEIPKTEEVLKEFDAERFEKRIFESTDWLLIDEGLTTLDYQLSKCCNPIPGDKIFGFITVSKGTKIHKQNCPNAGDLINRYPYRIVKAKWNNKNIKSDFITTISIAGKDREGITITITKIITEEFKLKMRAIAINERKNNMFDGSIIVYVKNRNQINELVERLKKLKDILYVKEK